MFFIQALINNQIKSLPLKRVFLAFANETFRTDIPFPDYDGMYDKIDAEINNSNVRPWFTWLTSDQIAEAQQELIDNPLPDIRREIADPRLFNYEYKPANFTRFHE